MISGYQGGFSSSYDQPVSRAAVQNLDPVGSGWGGGKEVSSKLAAPIQGGQIDSKKACLFYQATQHICCICFFMHFFHSKFRILKKTFDHQCFLKRNTSANKTKLCYMIKKADSQHIHANKQEIKKRLNSSDGKPIYHPSHPSDGTVPGQHRLACGEAHVPRNHRVFLPTSRCFFENLGILSSSSLRNRG